MLRPQLRQKEEALVETASEMSAMEMELQVLILTFSVETYVTSSSDYSWMIGCRMLAFLPDLDHNRLQVLVDIALEISRQGIKPGSRKINGRYIHAHLASRLEGEHPTLNQRLIGCANFTT